MMPIVFSDHLAASHARSVPCLLMGVLAVLAAAPLASADTSDFRGVNWAVLGDNFGKDRLVLHGLDESDNYDTVRAKADAVYTGLENNLAINTVRLPVNTNTVGSAWWDAYSGVIDSATDRGLKVILGYWEDGAASGGRVNDMDAWNAMWDTVTDKYGNNSMVHFEPMNEPHGYSATEWTDMAAAWVDRHSSVPKERILVGGTGFCQDAKPVCADSRLDGTLVSYHVYTFFSGENDYDGWVRIFRDGLGDCASRAITTEFGAPMDTGLDYNDAASGDNFVRYIRAVTDSMNELSMGSTYWPAIGGKIHQGQGDDWYSIQKLQGSGTDLTLTTPNDSGVDRLQHGWGVDSAK
ncbi:putative hydrolase [Chaetomium sp. MPI-SDFR-AT-0129]|nr:putative hydrolase [Chaetomium sp. MPI-SDFR-AT-0129]